ncbi:MULTISPECIES: hypothetical protein [unclassified Paenibacillus]|uniref:hypothetical protein n=1 Tax=unclassified Paenibacillus TaxID=185978 RepID=UPI003635D35C
MRRYKNGFHIVVRDDDKKLFYVSERIHNDTFLIDRVTKAQEEGRNVICSSDESPKDEIIRNYIRSYPAFQLSSSDLL